MAADHAIEGLDDRGVLDGRIFCPELVQRRLRYLRDPAGLASGEEVFILQHLHDAQPGGRLYHFRDRTSLMAAFSSARSAYMRLSRVFSASSSLTRVSSDIVMLAYLRFHQQKMATLMPRLRHTSASGTPDSVSCKASGIRLSVKNGFFTGTHLA